MKESKLEKVIPENHELKYELTDSEKKEINFLIDYKYIKSSFKINNITKNEDWEFYLKALKNYLFQNESNKKKIVEEGDIFVIMKISEKMYFPNKNLDPKLYFILFKAIFDLYNSGLNEKYIIDYTDTIIKFIKKCKNKTTEIVLANFVDLFEVLIYLNVKKMSDQNMLNLKENLDSLLKESLKSNQIENKLDSFFALIKSKIKSQQYVIFDLLLDYIKKISSIMGCEVRPAKLNLYIYHGILKPIFQLQMNKNVSLIDENFYKGITERICMENNFERYYFTNEDLMNDIFKISIEESYPKNNKRNNHAWELFSIFIEKWCTIIKAKELNQNESRLNSPRTNKGNRFNSEKSYSALKIRNSTIKTNKINEEKSNLLKIDKNKYIYNLIPEVISLIMKLFEYDNIKVDERVSGNIIEIIESSTDSIKIEVKKKVLDGLKNEKIKNKLNLEKWLKFLIEKNLDKNFIKEYIDGIPTYDIDVYTKFQELLLIKGGNFSVEILEKLIDKIIDSENIINNKNTYKSIQKTLNSSYENVYKVYKTFIKAFKIKLIDIYNKNEEKKEDKNNNEEKENQEKKDKNILIFSENIVYELTELLLEENNLSSFHKLFINKEKEKQELFSNLYSLWAIDPISALILCIATERFELAFNIILNLKDIEFTDDIFRKLAKVVESFEKNDYKFFCDKLLSPSENIFFIKTLFGILMILPQGVAFDFLNEKLSNVQTLLSVEDDIDDILKKINENKKEIYGKIEMLLKYRQLKKSYRIEEK